MIARAYCLCCFFTPFSSVEITSPHSAPELYVRFAMFIQGHVYRRRDLHDQYGGQRQGGISTPSQYPFVMLFTGESGEQHGYADSWSADGLFLYKGEGQQGDMAFIRGNVAIRDHMDN